MKSLLKLLIISSIMLAVLCVGAQQPSGIPEMDETAVVTTTTISLATVFVYIMIRVVYGIFGNIIGGATDIGSDILERVGHRIVEGKW